MGSGLDSFVFQLWFYLLLFMFNCFGLKPLKGSNPKMSEIRDIIMEATGREKGESSL